MGHCLMMRKGEVHTKPVPLPTGYTKLAYIQSNGTQYVDTGFKPTGNTKIICDFWAYNQTNSQQGVFGSRPGDDARFTLFTGRSTKAFQADYNTAQSLANETEPINGVDLTKRTVVSMSNELVVNGIVIKSIGLATFLSSRNLYLFANNNSGVVQLLGSFYLYSCQIYDNGSQIRNFQPCKNSSGDVGLYDLVGKQFYANAGTGTFTGGEA